MRLALAVTLSTLAVTPASADPPVVVHGSAYATRAFNALYGACVVVAAGDVAAVVITECAAQWIVPLRGITVAFGPVGVASFNDPDNGGRVCWSGYVIRVTQPSEPVPFSGCADARIY